MGAIINSPDTSVQTTPTVLLCERVTELYWQETQLGTAEAGPAVALCRNIDQDPSEAADVISAG